MEDVLYFGEITQVFKYSTVLESDTGFNMGRASEISRDELNFQKFISRLRNKFNLLFLNALRTMYSQGIIRN